MVRMVRMDFFEYGKYKRPLFKQIYAQLFFFSDAIINPDRSLKKKIDTYSQKDCKGIIAYPWQQISDNFLAEHVFPIEGTNSFFEVILISHLLTIVIRMKTLLRQTVRQIDI